MAAKEPRSAHAINHLSTIACGSYESGWLVGWLILFLIVKSGLSGSGRGWEGEPESDDPRTGSAALGGGSPR
ncbi:hypothetical protein [Actinophytocola xinjiangensis]|uniref:hypothetical protein n=1 Tax=Actinophytocola xinjiangensis TaxID=485602 RepID=UPI0013906714|nr:hypothetical protein [Actinophytocola xinjiangensis]